MKQLFHKILANIRIEVDDSRADQEFSEMTRETVI